MAARARRREMRESQSPMLTTPIENIAGIASATGAQQSARGQLDFGQEDADHILRAPPPMSAQSWEKLLEFDHPTMMAYMEERGVPSEQLELMARVDGWRRDGWI